MSEITQKPKRTITPEQREKMAEGRKRAMEERRKTKELIKKEEKDAKTTEKKLAKEQEKQKAREEKLKKEEQKRKDLEIELAGLQQQKDRIESLKKTMENRNKFRDKIQKFKEKEVEESRPKMTIESLSPVEEVDEDDYEELVVPSVKTAPAQLAPPAQLINLSDITPPRVIDKAQIVRSEVSRLLETTKNKKVRDIFKKLTNNYNTEMDVTENLKVMMDDLKKLIIDNTKELKKADKIIEEEESKKAISQKTLDEVKEEQKYKSQLSSLMRLR